MIYRFIGLLFVFCLVLSSCGDDCDNLEEVIVGTWGSSSLGPDNFSFLADGTLDDPFDVLLEFEVNGILFDDKTWIIDGDDQIVLRAESELDPSQFGELTLDVHSFDCKLMEVTGGGVSVTLDKR